MGGPEAPLVIMTRYASACLPRASEHALASRPPTAPTVESPEGVSGLATPPHVLPRDKKVSCRSRDSDAAAWPAGGAGEGRGRGPEEGGEGGGGGLGRGGGGAGRGMVRREGRGTDGA